MSRATAPSRNASPPAARAACHRPVHAVGVDLKIKAANLKRLRRVEGQLRGIQQMVEQDRYCADVLDQIAAAQSAMRAVGRELMRNHLHHCAARSIQAGGTSAEAMYDELIELMYRNAR